MGEFCTGEMLGQRTFYPAVGDTREVVNNMSKSVVGRIGWCPGDVRYRALCGADNVNF